MFGRRGFIGMIGAALGFEVASKAAIGSSAPTWAEILPYVTPTFPEDEAGTRLKLAAATRLIAERTPVGQEIALYPCGCSASGAGFFVNSPPVDLPHYCSEHGDPEHTDRCHIINGVRAMPAVIWG